MRKVWKYFLIISAMVLMIQMPIRAADARVEDNAALFTDQEIQELETIANQIASDYDTNVFILTDYQSGFSDNYARDVIEEYGTQKYPEGYIGYMINMADRSYWVDAYGERERSYFTQDKTDAIAENAADDLYDGEFGQSARTFLKGVERNFAIKTNAYGPFTRIIVNKGLVIAGSIGSVIAGVLIAGLMTGLKVAKHRDKKVSLEASNYQAGLNLVRRDDRLVRTYQTRVRKPKQTSSGGGFSGGGGSAGHTGSGGHF
ncbi:TPM domain-containing protein [Erysipelotrichaceae bacterium RD49]|nr:TPM domain-containing protein [Erysipelotrichaceae bacterium RD49]